MYLAATLLRLRREMPDLWLEGTYQPLRGGDAASDRHLVAFARQHGSRVAVVVVPRFLHELMPSDTHWPPTGFDVWKTMHVELPEELAGLTLPECVDGRGGASARLVARGHAAGRRSVQNTAGSGAAGRAEHRLRLPMAHQTSVESQQ